MHQQICSEAFLNGLTNRAPSVFRRYGISPTTVQKWHKRETTADMPMGPSELKS